MNKQISWKCLFAYIIKKALFVCCFGFQTNERTKIVRSLTSQKCPKATTIIVKHLIIHYMASLIVRSSSLYYFVVRKCIFKFHESRSTAMVLNTASHACPSLRSLHLLMLIHVLFVRDVFLSHYLTHYMLTRWSCSLFLVMLVVRRQSLTPTVSMAQHCVSVVS